MSASQPNSSRDHYGSPAARPPTRRVTRPGALRGSLSPGARPGPAPSAIGRAERRGSGSRIPLDGWTAPRVAGWIAVLALVATFTSHSDFYIADSRFDHYWNSIDFFGSHRFVWESARGLGAPAVFYTPVVAALLALFHLVGLSPATAERLFHACALATAGLGMFHALKLFRPGRGLELLVAPVVYAFNPYSAQFLLPSNLFLSYVAAPWLLAAAVRGARGDHPWRWAAVAALAVFSVGSVNPASLGFALIPAACGLVYVQFVERSASVRSIGAWAWRAGLLSLLVSLPALVQGAANADLVAGALESTERARDIGRVSSWSESWRGLGFWLSYFADGSGLVRSEAAAFFTRSWVVLATFAIPIGALAVLWRSRWRARLLFAGMTIPALAFMVGVFPVDDPAPFGRLLDNAYGTSSLAFAFRTGYKAGNALMVGTSALIGVGAAVAIGRAWRVQRAVRLVRVGVVSAVALTLLAASFPFWTGRLYSDKEQLATVPPYWKEATSWLDDRPGAGRVLILPGTDRTRYRWGYAGDDIFDAMLSRPHMQPSGLWQGTAESVNLLHGLDERISGRAYLPGSIGPIARRIGVRWIVVRNDLDWQRLEVPRPADLAGLRADPDLERVASFGAPGENVFATETAGGRKEEEFGLQPVEVFAVRDFDPEMHLTADAVPLVVSGDGDAWPRLAEAGFLDDHGPIAYSGDLTAAELGDALETGAAVVITDAARRRTVHTSAEHVYRSHALAPGEFLGRSTTPLFATEGAHTRATFSDAVRIEASSYGRWYRSFDRWARPANAFDGETATAWQIEPAGGPVGEWVRVVLREEAEISSVAITLPHQDPGLVRATRVTVRLSDGTRASAALTERVTAVSFSPRHTRWVEVRIDAVAGVGGPGAGFAEITIPGLDLAEWIRVPDDVVRAAPPDSRNAELLGAAPLTYLFERVAGEGPTDEEVNLRRRFRTAGTRDYQMSGSVTVTSATPDLALDSLLGGELGASGTSRFSGFIDRRGTLATDGNPGTGWQVDPRPGEVLTVRFAPRNVAAVDLYVAVRDPEGFGGEYSRPRRLTVRVPGSDLRVERDLVATPAVECDPLFLPGACLERHHVVLPNPTTGVIEVELGDVDPSVGSTGYVPVKIAEVTVTGDDGQVLLGSPQPLPTDCVDLFVLDGRPVSVSIDGTLDDLMAGRQLRFEACGPLTLDPGEHALASAPGFPGFVDYVELTSPAESTTPADDARSVGAARLKLTESSPTRRVATVDVPAGGAYLVTGQSFDPKWQASVDGRDLGRPQALDTFAAWRLPPGRHVVLVQYEPQRQYELAIAIASGAVVVCLVLSLREPLRRASRRGGGRRRAMRRLWRGTP